jgi:hypothetical protein
VAYADGKAPPPYPLRYALQAGNYGALPEAGGLRDQPVRVMAQMAACLNVYQAWRSYMRAPDKVDFARAHPELWRVVKEILRDGQHH